MNSLLAMVLMLRFGGLGPGDSPADPPATPPVGLVEHASQIPGCAEGVATCVGVRVFVAGSEGKAVVTPEWLAGQFERANELLGGVGVGFQLHSIEFLPSKFKHVRTRGERDELGAKRWKKGYINVFVAGVVDNVDEKGQIYGVHWRWKKNKARRWIILSAEAWPMTFVHELGHYFGLSHNALIGSIMNKAGNDPTPISDRVFLDGELETIGLGLKGKLKGKELVPQTPRLPPLP